MMSLVTTRVAMVIAMGGACCEFGCSLAAAPVYGHEITKGPSPRALDEGQTTSVAVRGTLHPQQTGHAIPRPQVVGLESEISNPWGTRCCRSRITALAGASWLPLSGSVVGAEVLGGWMFGQTAVADRMPFSTGLTLRTSLNFRLWTVKTWPCDKRPYAAATLLVSPELGLQALAPMKGSDTEVRTEGMGLLWVKLVGWSGLPVF